MLKGVLGLLLLIQSTSVMAKGSSHVERMPVLLRQSAVPPCMWRATVRDWIDLNAIVMLRTVDTRRRQNGEVRIQLAGMRDSIGVSAVDPERYIARIIRAQQQCQHQ